MKAISYLALLAITFFAVSCNSNTSNNKVEATDSQAAMSAEGPQKLVVDAAKSTIHWKGFKPGGSHHGTLGLKSGELSLDGSTLKSGSFVLDMNAIVNEDLTDDKMKEQLVGHLKSADFFDVEKYPEGSFTITSVEEVSKTSTSADIKISGNLELKGVSKNISFDAKVVVDGDTFTATTPVFTIDRIQWGVNYGSKNIFKDLKDKFINDEMEINMVIVAKKS